MRKITPLLFNCSLKIFVISTKYVGYIYIYIYIYICVCVCVLCICVMNCTYVFYTKNMKKLSGVGPFKLIDQVHMASLRTFCSVLSASIYIKVIAWMSINSICSQHLMSCLFQVKNVSKKCHNPITNTNHHCYVIKKATIQWDKNRKNC